MKCSVYYASYVFFLGGFFILFHQRSVLNFAIWYMSPISAETIPQDLECPNHTNHTHIVTGNDLHWSELQKSYALSAFYQGYILTQVVGGEIYVTYLRVC